VMAYLAMRQIEAPRSVGDIVVKGDNVTASGGARLGNVTSKDGSVAFDLDLPFLPFYVPKEARKALELVPLQDDLNRFRLRVVPSTKESTLILSIDGKTAGVFKAEELSKGIDLALLDGAPWSEAGRTLWEATQFRWKKHFEAWRQMGLQKPALMLPALPTFEPHARAQRAYADELGRSLQTLARPRTYRISLRPPGDLVPISTVDLSPTYPLDRFDTALPPERGASGVVWTSAPLADGKLDLGLHFPGATNVAAYVRVVLEAEEAATLHLALGSDDGLAVFLGGRRVLARDVMRGLRPGEDEVELDLVPGRNEVLFKVTQGGGDFGLAVEAHVRGKGKVRQVAAR
jgi:hypothetical protein